MSCTLETRRVFSCAGILSNELLHLLKLYDTPPVADALPSVPMESDPVSTSFEVLPTAVNGSISSCSRDSSDGIISSGNPEGKNSTKRSHSYCSSGSSKESQVVDFSSKASSRSSSQSSDGGSDSSRASTEEACTTPSPQREGDPARSQQQGWMWGWASPTELLSGSEGGTGLGSKARVNDYYTSWRAKAAAAAAGAVAGAAAAAAAAVSVGAAGGVEDQPQLRPSAEREDGEKSAGAQGLPSASQEQGAVRHEGDGVWRLVVLLFFLKQTFSVRMCCQPSCLPPLRGGERRDPTEPEELHGNYLVVFVVDRCRDC